MNKSVLFISLLAAFAASADEAPETITVIGTRAESDAVLPAVVHVISTEEIEQSGALTLADLLATQVGIFLSDNIGNNGRGVSVSMRGFSENSSNNVLILVDGRKLNNPSLAGADLSSVAIQTIERIEILQGSAGSLYGDQASAGVINIITKSTSFEETHLNALAGSFGSSRFGARYAKKINDELSTRLSFVRFKADNYRDNNENVNTDVNAKLQWRNQIAGVAFSVQEIKDDLRFPGSLSEEEFRLHPRRTNTPDDFGNAKTMLKTLNSDWSISDSWQLYFDLTDRQLEVDGQFWSSDFTTRTDVTLYQPRAVARIETGVGIATLTTGIDHEESGYRSDYGIGISDFAQRITDVYAQVLWPVVDVATVSLALRRSQFDFAPLTSSQDYTDAKNVYQFGLSHQFDSLRVFGRYDQGFRWPNADENGFIDSTNGVEHLDVQRSGTKELGAEWRQTNQVLTVSVFDIDMDGEIVYDPAAGLYGANINRDFTHRIGANLSHEWQLAGDIRWLNSVSVIDAEFDGGDLDGNEIPFVAKQSAKSQWFWSLNEAWSVYVDALYTGSRFRAGDNANSAGKLGGFTAFNASVKWQMGLLGVQLRVNNLADKHYSGYSSTLYGSNFYYPAATRNIALTADLSF